MNLVPSIRMNAAHLPRHPPSKFGADQVAAAGRLFSAEVLREMGRRGRSPIFARLARQSALPLIVNRTQPIRDVFEAAFALLKQTRNRDEYIYKAAITHNVLLGVHSLRTAAMLMEFRVGGNKADVAILNGTSTVYEVKSERDSLRRLESQLAAYRNVFARVNVVCGENHLESVLRLSPADVGVIVLTAKSQMSTVREASDMPERICPLAVFDSIGLHEAEKILAELAVPTEKVPNTQLYATLRGSFAQLDARETHFAMVKVLRRTRSLLPLAALLGALPVSLHAAACATPLRKQDHARLVQAVSTPLQQALAWS